MASGLIGGGDERFGGLFKVGVHVDEVLDHGVRQETVQAVGAEEEDVARDDVDGDGVGGDEELLPEGAGEQVAAVALGGFGGREDAEADLLVGDGVVAGEGAPWPLRKR
jgi:hypothetical protein